MKKTFLLVCFFIVPILISAQQHRLDSVRASYRNRLVDEEIDNLLNKHVTPKHNYYQFVPLDNSGYTIIWGNDSIKNQSKNEYADLLGIRVSLEFENSKFIFLHTWTGSGVWQNIVLPLKQGYGDFMIENPIAYDTTNNRVVTELCCMGDKLLEVLDFNGQGSLYIVDSLIKCSSVQIDFCIDSIILSDTVLKVNWIVPNKIDKPNSIIKRTYKIYAR
jgi:hypothetical protein